jgi:hypothetical protein
MAVSKSAWKKAAVHTVTLPSGMEVDITVPSLSKLAKLGKLENALLSDATPAPIEGQEVVAPNPDAPPTVEERKKALADLADFQSWLVSITLVDPKLTPEEVLEYVPTEDLEVLVEFATRKRDMDVKGHHLGGLEKSADWREFRGLPPLGPDLLDE